MSAHIPSQFSLKGRRVLITGGTGVLCGAIARGLAQAGADVILTGRRPEATAAVAAAMRAEGLAVTSLVLDVMQPESLARVADEVSAGGRLDILINGVGGNQKEATAMPGERTFFDLPLEALRQVVDLNLFGGAIAASQAFGRLIAANPEGGVIVNIASMNAVRPLTRVVAYSAAKAAVANFTQWLAVHLAQEFGPKLRVNAIAPGFFLTPLNRPLLLDEATGQLSERGRRIVDHTPMGRFGEAEELAGTAVWLCSDAARFVTGIMVPVDGGFSAYSGI